MKTKLAAMLLAAGAMLVTAAQAGLADGGVLAQAHDAAQVKWGGGWRMPTKDELTALNNNCDWIWTTTNSVNGYIVRGKGNYASASIFLPAVGYGYGTSLGDAGSYGGYWSSVPCSDYYDSGGSTSIRAAATRTTTAATSGLLFALSKPPNSGRRGVHSMQ